jgi:hypothetical protein
VRVQEKPPARHASQWYFGSDECPSNPLDLTLSRAKSSPHVFCGESSYRQLSHRQISCLFIYLVFYFYLQFWSPPILRKSVDRRALEGQQLVEEMIAFGEHFSPPIGDRAVFVRAFSTGFPIAGWVGEMAYGEIGALTDLVESFLADGRVTAK